MFLSIPPENIKMFQGVLNDNIVYEFKKVKIERVPT